MVSDVILDSFEEFIGKNDYGLLFRVFHRSFNANHSEEMYRFEFIGEGFLSLSSLLKDDRKTDYNDFLELEPLYPSATLNRTSQALLKLRISGEASPTVRFDDEYGRPGYGGNLPGKYPSYRGSETKKYEDDQQNDEDGLQLDDYVIDNFMKTLDEVNQNTRDIQGSAEKIRRHLEEERNIAGDNEERDVEDYLQSHQRTINDIANINKNLDDIFSASSFTEKGTRHDDEGRPDQQRDQKASDSPIKERIDIKDITGGIDERFTTGSFSNKLGETNPFTKNLERVEEGTQESQPDTIRNPEETSNVLPGREEERKRDEYTNRPVQEVEEGSAELRESGSGARPPSNKDSMSSSFRKMEQKFPKTMKDSGELDRIARIMKPGLGQKKKMYESSSDSD